MSDKKSGMNFEEVLQLIFIVLKLAKIVDWSWLWVLSPTWISILVLVALWIWIKVS